MEINSTSTSYTTSQTCPHILPCGMCRLTMSQCPRGWMYKKWDTTPVYCSSDNISTAGTAGIGGTVGHDPSGANFEEQEI